LALYPSLLTDYKTAIIRPANGNGGSQPLGTGPFRLSSYARARIFVERNPQYWKGTSAVLDSIEFRPELSAAQIAAGVRSGDLDLARDLLPRDVDEFQIGRASCRERV